MKVDEAAPVVGETLDDAKAGGLIESDLLVIAVDREGEDGVTPTGETVLEAGDIVTLFSRSGLTGDTVRPFSDG